MKERALEALCEHLGERKARGFVALLWLGEPMWWQQYEWEKLQRTAPWLPTWDANAVRELFPASLVPEATSMRELASGPMAERVLRAMDDPAALEDAVEHWLKVQQAHGIALITASDVRARFPGPDQIDAWIQVRDEETTQVLGALDHLVGKPASTVRPPFPELHDEQAWQAAEAQRRIALHRFLDDAPLILDSTAFGRHDLVSWVTFDDLTHRGWDEELGAWATARETWNRPSANAWFYADGPNVPDYPAWRDTWMAILKLGTARIRGAMPRANI